MSKSIEAKPKPPVAAIYARCGSPDKTVADEHVRLCRLKIKDSRWTVGDAYVDAGRVDTTIEARPELLKLLGDAERGIFSCVVAISPLALGGSAKRTTSEIIRRLEAVGVTVHFVETAA